MKIIILTVLLLVSNALCCVIYAQEAAGKIQGKVTDPSGKAIEYANVILRKATDPAIVKVAVADSVGAFDFSGIQYGRYVITISFIGYKERSTAEFDVNEALTRLPNSVVEADVQVLNAVEVTSSRPLVERKIDRTIVNVEASIMSVGESAMDVLEKSPGVSVDKDGNVALRGRSGVTIFIDGRPTYLSGGDLANFLRNLQASQLDQIELMTNPPAQYDAAGNGGVINIKTKKVQLKGFNGSFSATYLQGRYPAHNESAIFNYRTGKINLYSNLAYADRNGFEEYTILRNLRDENTYALQTIYDQKSFTKTHNQSLNAKIGLDYFFKPNTVLGFVASGYHNPGDASTENQTLLKNPDGVLQTSVIAPATAQQKWQNLNLDLNFKHTFDTMGRELSADASYLLYDSRNQQYFENNFYNSEGGIAKPQALLQNDFPQNIKIYSGKIDYVYPLSRSSKLEIGVKSSYVTTDNDALYQRWTDNGWLRNDTLSNHFVYKENINAAYANYRKQVGKWEVQVGIRGEQTTSEGQQITTNEVNKRNYLRLFPTAYLAYTLNKEQKLALTYGRRIKRPDYQDMNPFRVYLDQYTYEKGNPFLQPQYSHNVELSYLLYEGAITTSLAYSKTSGIIQSVIRQDLSKNETYLQPENISHSQVYGINMNAEIPVTDRSVAILYWEFNRNELNGTINEKPFVLNANTFSGNVIYQHKLQKGWTIETGVWYTSRSIEGTFLFQPYGKFGAAIKKNVLKKQGSLRLSANDIFKWNKYVGTSQYQNIDISLDNRWQTQTIKLTFTYNFRHGAKVAEVERKSGAEDTQERIKTKEK